MNSQTEMRLMMEDVADKAADRAADRVGDKLRLEMMEMEQRIRCDISKDMDSKFVQFLGMTPQEHTIQHAAISDFLKLVQSISNGFWKKIFITMFLIATVSVAGSLSLSSVIHKMPVSKTLENK